MIRNKKISAVELIELHLNRIRQVNGKLNAVVTFDRERALNTARYLDELTAKGKFLGSLHGVPMTVKDSFDTAGLRTTYGSEGSKNFVPSEDATVVKRLKRTGVIQVAKTNTPELTWAFETDNGVFGRTNNPYDLNLSPGGSSGGAAAIVAAGGAPFDIGSDTGGSIRLPAHLCGICGLKPTSGRVPRTGHIISADGTLQSFTQLGPLARSVEDLWRIFKIVVGPDNKDPWVVQESLGDPSAIKTSGLRVAFHTDNGIRSPDGEVASAAMKVAAFVERQGAKIREDKPGVITEAVELDRDLYSLDGGASLRKILDRLGTKEPGAVVAASITNKPMSKDRAAEVVDRWHRWQGQMLGFWNNYDAIICPPCAVSKLPHGSSYTEEAYQWFSYTYVYNMTGWPAVVVPVGFTGQGLPIGIQIVTPPWREDVAIALAAQVEREFGGYRRPAL